MARKKTTKTSAAKEEVKRGIVRIAGRDLKGTLPLKRALIYVKGISFSTVGPIAKLIEERLGIPRTEKIGNLSDEQIEAIDHLLFNLSDQDLPEFLLNRRRDIWSGENLHLIMNDLDFATRMSIERKKKMYNWQGYRHIRGKKVRGQRTKNTGRKGVTVGVTKKKK
ncbi:MAG: 30S ribosomal protein S13 [Candidatus Micrarchaeota archaeon]|nr:30S ribosomal protein S13 [Candidatus Micrarchaeota archaeon]